MSAASNPPDPLQQFLQEVITSSSFSQRAKDDMTAKIAMWMPLLNSQSVYTKEDIVRGSLEKAGIPENLIEACLTKLGKGNSIRTSILFYSIRVHYTIHNSIWLTAIISSLLLLISYVCTYVRTIASFHLATTTGNIRSLLSLIDIVLSYVDSLLIVLSIFHPSFYLHCFRYHYYRMYTIPTGTILF